MKIIEAMKKIKHLEEKTGDLSEKIKMHCADMDFENPVYSNQKEIVSGWIQSHNDVVKEISRLKYCLHKTNVMVEIPIIINGKSITKSIDEWIHRRHIGINLEKRAWQSLTDKNLKDQQILQSSGDIKLIKIRRYYDPKERDEYLSLLNEEPSIIDGTLEIANATIDLME